MSGESDSQKTRPPLIFQSRVRAAPSVVFEAFFGQPQRWLCREATIDGRLGGTLRLCWPDGCFEGQFVQWAPPTTARFSWRPQGEAMPDTMVVVTAEAALDGQTALELEHYGFGVGPDWDGLYLGATRAWAGYLKNLRAVLEIGVDLREPDE
ncbi:MAG: SRPBCC domain-containing protein [Chloroflexi bacterium]|nr:SRPBCC domain-containing protein [Chloroflexota bacterium]MBV9603008.1 SRPBCC domain-containing protein [Chloroflexota bacterium]